MLNVNFPHVGIFECKLLTVNVLRWGSLGACEDLYLCHFLKKMFYNFMRYLHQW